MKATQRELDMLVWNVLRFTPVDVFNESIRAFSVERLYYRAKHRLMSEYPTLLTDNLTFGIVMADAFRQYQVDATALQQMKREMDKLKGVYQLMGKHTERGYKAAILHDQICRQYNQMLAPQNQLIRLYKKAQKSSFPVKP